MKLSKRNNKIVITLIIIGVFLSSINFVFAEENDEYLVSSKKFLSERDFDNSVSTDIADVSKELILEIDTKKIKETLDNGTILYMGDVKSDIDLIEIGNRLGEVYEPQEKTELEALQGAYLTYDNQGGYNITEIIAEIVEPCDESGDKKVDISKKVLKETLNEITRNSKVDLEKICLEEDAAKRDLSKLELSNTAIGQLQSGSIVASSFMDKSATYILYGMVGTTTVCEYGNTSWGELSRSKVTGYVAKIKTKNSITYDALYGSIIVDPNSKFKVIQYNAKLGVPANSRYTLLEPSFLKSGDKTTNVSVGISAGEGGGSVGLTYSYTYDANGQDIINNTGNKYTDWWKCMPISPVKDASYKVNPSVIIKANDGKTSTATGYVYLSYQTVKGLAGTFTCDTDKKITLKFKNHTEAS